MKQLLRKACALSLLTSFVWAQSNTVSSGGAPAGTTSAAPTSATSNTSQSNSNQAAQGRHPNILFIIMDDVGIDQLRVFGYGGPDAPRTPNIDAIAHAGVRFRNVWSMPECSPSRAIFFEGRYPLRTNVLNALIDDDLANSQVSPYEATTPKLLKTHGYASGNFGKFHLAQVQNNPFGDRIVQSLGWDYFDGFLDGAPHPIDETAGGITDKNEYSCGFVPNASAGGADYGSCHFVDNTCKEMSATPAEPTPGFSCLREGGVFVPNLSCGQAPPSPPNFNRTNGYYVWPRVINHLDGRVEEVPLSDPRARGYLGEVTTSSAIQWINDQQAEHKSWMATVAYSQVHTPYQQPPANLLGKGAFDTTGLVCTGNEKKNIAAYHILSNQMIEAMDTEIGRMMVEAGLATYRADGGLNYQPGKTDTMVVIVGDNGTYAAGVKPPFDVNRSKGTVYQTGVWVPLIVAGPLVNVQDRDVNAMVSITDMFQLFGEIAGIDVYKAVPKSHTLDSVTMLPYLTNPKQPSLRQTNFTQTGTNIHTGTPPPCVIPLTDPPTCVQIFTNKGVCEYEGGIYYPQYTSCCEVEKNVEEYKNNLYILPDWQNAIRNDQYKLVQRGSPDCSAPTPTEKVETEFYRINEAVPVPALDREQLALCSGTDCPQGLNHEQLTNFNNLLDSMEKLLSSEPACPGDGNEDKVVNQKDVDDWKLFDGHGSSWYDFNYDGKTDNSDLAVINANLGTKCRRKP